MENQDRASKVVERATEDFKSIAPNYKKEDPSNIRLDEMAKAISQEEWGVLLRKAPQFAILNELNRRRRVEEDRQRLFEALYRSYEEDRR